MMVMMMRLLKVMQMHPDASRLRSASSNQLAAPSFNLSTFGKRAFPVSGANFWSWNSLPLHVTFCTIAGDIQTAS